MTKLQDIYVALVFNKHNMQTLHWNNVGLDFDPVHEKLAEYIDQFQDYIDEVAEIIRIMGGRPLNLIKCIEAAKVSSVQFLILEEKDYITVDVWENCKIIFEQMINMISDTGEKDGYPRDVISKLDEISYWFKKESRLKTTSRLYSGSSPVLTATVMPEDEPVEHNDISGDIPVEPEETKVVLHDEDSDDDIIPETEYSEEDPDDETIPEDE